MNRQNLAEIDVREEVLWGKGRRAKYLNIHIKEATASPDDTIGELTHIYEDVTAHIDREKRVRERTTCIEWQHLECLSQAK